MKEDYIQTGRTRQKLETRRKILSSAQYFLNNALEFNLEDVAKRTGISRATIYRYYSNVEVLAAEAALDIKSKHPEVLYRDLKATTVAGQVLEIQEYFNTQSTTYENAYRKYLSAVIVSNTAESKRGARRTRTLEMVLEHTSLTAREKKDFSHLFTVLMGMEPLIVTRDVCGLDPAASKKLLRWGMELLLKGLPTSQDR